MAKRIAPGGGYDFGAKRQYRRTVWRKFREYCVGRRDLVKALLMPSSEGDEVDVAKANGFREENLVIADANAAIVATLKRTRFPKVIAKGGQIDEIGRRLAREGHQIEVANLDLTSHIAGVAWPVAGFVESGCLTPRSVVAVTMLKGREGGEVRDTLNRLKREVSRRTQPVFKVDKRVADLPRAARIEALCRDDSKFHARLLLLQVVLRGSPDTFNPAPREFGVIDAGEYRSTSGQTMIWIISKVHVQPCDCDMCCATVKQRIGLFPLNRRWRDRAAEMMDVRRRREGRGERRDHATDIGPAPTALAGAPDGGILGRPPSSVWTDRGFGKPERDRSGVAYDY